MINTILQERLADNFWYILFFALCGSAIISFYIYAIKIANYKRKLIIYVGDMVLLKYNSLSDDDKIKEEKDYLSRFDKITTDIKNSKSTNPNEMIDIDNIKFFGLEF